MQRAVWKEPLVHFVVIGVLLFALDARRAPEAAAEPKVIVVDAALREELARGFAERRGRAPDDAELAAQIDRWHEDEALYRKGLSLGLERSDPLVRTRIIDKMRMLLSSSATAREPSEEELRARFTAAPERYRREARFDFEQVALAAGEPARAEALRETLAQGADPHAVTGSYRAFTDRSRENVSAMFGAAFTEALASMPARTWQVLASERGVHVVRRTSEAAAPVTFESVRETVAADWRLDQQRAQVVETLGALKKEYEVREGDG